MNFYTLTLKSATNLEDLWGKLSLKGVEPLYSEEDELNLRLHIQALDEHVVFIQANFPEIISVEKSELPEINWTEQWHQHAPHYQEGYLNLPLGSQSLQLLPGPGFGDLSHATTQLMIEVIQKIPMPAYVIDVGCGSGILACAAGLLGANRVDGIDIDPEAVKHSQQNAELNQLDAKVHFYLPPDFQPFQQEGLILMNMIMSEQTEAWGSLMALKAFKGQMITTGILTEQQEAYLGLVQGWGWHFEQSWQAGDWLALKFTK